MDIYCSNQLTSLTAASHRAAAHAVAQRDRESSRVEESLIGAGQQPGERLWGEVGVFGAAGKLTHTHVLHVW